MTGGQESLATGLQSGTGAVGSGPEESEKVFRQLLAAVFPWGIAYDERHYGPAVDGFDDFQNHDGVVAVIFASINELTFQIRSQVFQDGGEVFSFDEGLAIQETVGLLCSGEELLRKILLIASDDMQYCYTTFS